MIILNSREGIERRESRDRRRGWYFQTKREKNGQREMGRKWNRKSSCLVCLSSYGHQFLSLSFSLLSLSFFFFLLKKEKSRKLHQKYGVLCVIWFTLKREIDREKEREREKKRERYEVRKKLDSNFEEKILFKKPDEEKNFLQRKIRLKEKTASIFFSLTFQSHWFSIGLTDSFLFFSILSYSFLFFSIRINSSLKSKCWPV